METKETRVRMGAKQTSKGTIQLDITAEAPTVNEAGRLMENAIPRFREALKVNGLQSVDQPEPKGGEENPKL